MFVISKCHLCQYELRPVDNLCFVQHHNYIVKVQQQQSRPNREFSFKSVIIYRYRPNVHATQCVYYIFNSQATKSMHILHRCVQGDLLTTITSFLKSNLELIHILPFKTFKCTLS